MQVKAQVRAKPSIFRKARLNRGEYLWGYLLIAPFFIGLAIFYIWPVFQTFYFSFTEWGEFNNYAWSGADNYVTLAKDTKLLGAFKNTFIFVLISVPCIIAISIITAVLLNQKVRGLTIYRTLFFLPVVTMPAAVSMVWKWLYNGDYGLFNYVLSLFSIKGPNWLSDPNVALVAVVVVAIWMSNRNLL